MAKAGAPKKAKPKLKLTDKEQSERFIETARELGAENSSDNFDRVFREIVPTKSKKPKPDRNRNQDRE
jgi:hypothetical protein